MGYQPILRIGTRASALALKQTDMFIAQLCAHFVEFRESDSIEIVKITSSGDREHAIAADQHLRDSGGKGLFTKELEEALLHNRIDIAVHSMKDVPTWIPEGLVLAGVLSREDVRDALIAPGYGSIKDLPAGAVFGTSSLRRQSQLLALRPDLKVVALRGNVETRLRKISEGKAAATLLAMAGLKRLGLLGKAMVPIETSEILPAACQGIVGLEVRANDTALQEKISKISCAQTATAMVAERAMLATLDGSCQTPIAAYASITGQELLLQGLVAHPEGKGVWTAQARTTLHNPVELGRDVGRTLRGLVPAGILPE